MKKIFVTLSTFAQHGEAPMDLLEDSGYEYSMNSLGRRIKKEELLTLPKDISGIIAGVEIYDEEVLEHFSNLKCISRCGVGIDNICVDYAKKRKIKICNTPEVVIQPVAELTLAMMFDLLRRVTLQTNFLRARRWEKRTGNLLKGKKVGILGLGGIGKRVAEMLVSLGVDVYGSDVYPDRKWAEEFGIKVVSCERLLRESDVLSLHLAYDSENRFLLSKTEIDKMKKGAFLVNLARGQFVDENALFDALVSDQLGGAGIDVFSEEPYSGKLCDLDNVILTPHVATLTVESRLQMETEATRNIIEALKD